MSFKEVSSLDCEVTTALGGRNKSTGKANPTSIEGYLLGSKEVANRLSKTGFSKIHIFQTEKGNIGVWGKTDLDRKMLNVPTGAMTRVTQSGKVPTPNGDMYKFKVEVDVNNTIDVAYGDVDNQEATQTAATGDDDGYEESAVDEEETSLDEIPPTRAATPAKQAANVDATRQKKVQDLLNRTRGKSA